MAVRSHSDEDPLTANANHQDVAERASARLLAGLLLLAGVLVGLCPLIGVVTTADGSLTDAVTIAAFTAVLPGLLAVALAVPRPVLGLAATAGAGLIGLARIFADLALLTEIDGVTRPELFYETTDRARPFAATGGGWLLLAADLLMVVAGVLAAGRLARAGAEDSGAGREPLFGSTPDRAPDPAVARAVQPAVVQPDAVQLAAVQAAVVQAEAVTDVDPELPVDASVLALSEPSAGRIGRNLPMIGVGFLGAILLMVGALETPYSGGYLTLRVLPLGASLTGVLAAALLPLLAAVSVVVAATLPRPVAAALLSGTALAAAVPPLTAIVAVAAGAPTSVSSSAWWGLAGAAVLASAGLLARRRGTSVDRSEGDDGPPSPMLTLAAGGLILLAAAASFAASRTALLQVNGAAPDDAAATVLARAGPRFLVAAFPLAVAGVLLLIPPAARIGRAAAGVVWAAPVYALGQALALRSLVVASADNPLNADLPAEVRRTWTTGAGLWWGVVAVALAVAAAVLAVITARRVEEASLQMVLDDSVMQSRSVRVWTAAGLTVLTLVSCTLPVYSVGLAASSTLFAGYDLDTWGIWAVAVAVTIACWAATVTRRPAVAVGYLVAAAAVAAVPLIVPAAVRDAAGFAWGPGLWVGGALVVALLAAAPVFAADARRVRTLDVASWSSGVSDPVTGGEAVATSTNTMRTAKGR